MKVLIIATNVNKYKTTKKTGVWISELTHFYDYMREKNINVTIASPEGGNIPIDPRSLKFPAMDASVRKRLESSKFIEQLENSLSVDALNPEEYEAVYFAGGHGTMWDFYDNSTLNQFIQTLYENGGIVASVCHGYCALIACDLSDGTPLIQNKNITGYSWLEEKLAGVSTKIPYNAEEKSKNRGGDYKKHLIPFYPYVVKDGRLITGQNPFSTKKLAKKVYKALLNT